MRFGSYYFDSFWLSILIALLASSWMFHELLVVLFMPIIFGLKYEKPDTEN
ncbi:hypothetical protein ACMGE7_04700 [Macrococcus equi]|uniref:hypothetical protein n=1 Tax=Macrococcus equi TaxID=3395462 RepID=UPI0039BDD121